MAQQVTESSSTDSTTVTSEFVIYNKDVKPIKPLHFASTSATVPVPPLASGSNVFGEEYDIFDGFNITCGVNKPSNNLFINALHLAFCNHLPLVLRPDDIWLQILQGLSIHIGENKDKLQTSIVNFADPDTKIKIIVRNDNLVADTTEEKNDVILKSNNINWKSVFNQFSEQCKDICAKNGSGSANSNSSNKKEEDEAIVDWGLCDFSTSSSVCLVASQCSLFSVLSHYISFDSYTMSGIPKITLKGTVDDWQLLHKKCENLKQLQCDFWYPHLMKVVGNIVESVKLLNDSKELSEELGCFWKSIYHYQDMSGGATVTGWCNAFIPYIYVNNKFSHNDCVSDGVKHDKDDFSWGIIPSEYPSSYTKAPMNWNYYGKDIKCEMIGGIVGIQQNKIDASVAPIVGWMVEKESTDKYGFKPKIVDKFSNMVYNF